MYWRAPVLSSNGEILNSLVQKNRPIGRLFFICFNVSTLVCSVAIAVGSARVCGSGSGCGGCRGLAVAVAI